MRFACLGSGSKGNATVIQSDETTLLVDCGFSAKEAVNRLSVVGLLPEQLDAILVTHEHGDHIRGVSVLSRRYGIPVWASRGTAQFFQDEDIELAYINVHKPFNIKDLNIVPVPVPHDAREPCQYIFQTDTLNFGVLTDLGRITSHIIEAYKKCEAILLEFNHDRDMLMTGSYPPSLKSRVGGGLGHLSNEQSCQLLQQILPGTLRFLVAGHLSESNNTPDHVQQAITRTLDGHDCHYEIAAQHDTSSWYQLDRLCA